MWMINPTGSSILLFLSSCILPIVSFNARLGYQKLISGSKSRQYSFEILRYGSSISGTSATTDCPVQANQPVYNTKGQVLSWWYTPKIILNLEVDGKEQDEHAVQSTGAATGAVKHIGAAATATADRLVTEMRSVMLSMETNFISEDGYSVNYTAMNSSKEMQQYTKLVRRLRHLDLSALADFQRKAFFINVYNMLTIHGLCSGLLAPSSATSTIARLKFYATASYVIDGAVYSLNDIENGILRGNKPSAAPFTQPPFGAAPPPSHESEFKNGDQHTTSATRTGADISAGADAGGDPRIKYVLHCDPRVHFALNCGAMSCPPIDVYSTIDPSLLEQQLQMATESFIMSGVRFIKKQSQLQRELQETQNESEQGGDQGGGEGEGGEKKDSRWIGFKNIVDSLFQRRESATVAGGTIELSKIFEWYKDDFVMAWRQGDRGSSDPASSYFVGVGGAMAGVGIGEIISGATDIRGKTHNDGDDAYNDDDSQGTASDSDIGIAQYLERCSGLADSDVAMLQWIYAHAHPEEQQSMYDFLTSFLPAKSGEVTDKPATASLKIRYKSYDWNLNQA